VESAVEDEEGEVRAKGRRRGGEGGEGVVPREIAAQSGF